MALFLRWFSLFFGLTLTLCSAGYAATPSLTPEEQAWVARHPTVTVLVVNTHIPMTFLNDDGAEAGLSVSLLDKVRELSGLKFQWRTFDNLAQMRAHLKTAPDSLIAVANASADQDPQILYSRPYQTYDWVLVTRKDLPDVTSLSEMAHQKVAVFTGSHYLPALRREYPDVEFVEHDFSLDTAWSLLTQTFAGAIVPQTTATFLLKSYLEDRFRVASRLPLAPLQIAMATSQQNAPLISLINKTLSGISPHEMDMELGGWQMRYALDRFEIWGRYRTGLLAAGVGAIVVTLLLGFYYWRSRILRSNLAIQQNLRRALQEANRQIEKTSEAKTVFLSQMSHEIRTPLNALIGLLELESRGRSTPEMREKNIAVAHASATSLLSLVGDILDMAKIESGKLTVRREPVSLRQTVEDIATLFRHSAEEKGLTLTASTNVMQDRILFDPVMLRQIMSNLLSNAVKFTAHGETELVVYQAADGRYVLEVSDSGPGLSEAQQRAIFEPFVQVGDKAPGQRGTGLGLSICRQLAELLEGTLTVESEQGEGSTFIFTFNAIACTEPKSQVSHNIRPATNASRHILIVDDHAPNRLLLEQQLAWAGHSSVSADNGEQALWIWPQADPPFDGLITDCNMPGMSGFELVQQLRALEQENGQQPRPMFGLTAMAEQEVLARAKAAGMTDCLFKPLDLSTLLARLDSQRPPVASKVVLTLETLTQQQPEALLPLVDALIAQNELDIAGLRQALDARDVEGIQRHAHSLLGGARLAGADGLAALCQSLEQNAANGDFSTMKNITDECATQVAQLQLTLQDLRQTAYSEPPYPEQKGSPNE